MDSGLSIRPTNATAPSGTVRPDAAPVREAVPTNLNPAQSVTAAPKAIETRAEDTSHLRKVILDAQSREVIYQVLNVSGQVVRQIPEEATLRLRAYVRAMANGATPNQAQMQADVDVEA